METEDNLKMYTKSRVKSQSFPVPSPPLASRLCSKKYVVYRRPVKMKNHENGQKIGFAWTVPEGSPLKKGEAVKKFKSGWVKNPSFCPGVGKNRAAKIGGTFSLFKEPPWRSAEERSHAS
jgi:hypothetical protein